MTAIARTLFRARRGVIEWWGLIVVAAFAWMIGLGQFSADALWAGDLAVLTGLMIFAFTLGRAVWREVFDAQPGRRSANAAFHELELGLLLLTGTYLLVMATGGVQSFLYPLVYALVSFLLVIHRHRWVAISWIVAACGLELLAARGSGASNLGTAAYHITFILFFAAGNLLILSSLAHRLRGRHGQAVDAEIARIRREARDFRLIASALPLASRAQRSRDEEELRMAAGAVLAVHEQLYFSIDLLCASLGLHTAALLWVDGETQAGARATPRLVIKEMATASELIQQTPSIDGPGILASLLRDPKPLRLKALAGRRVPPYYTGPEPITDLCAVPLMDGPVLRGLLCGDRVDDRPFTDEEEAVLGKAAGQILRIVAQERAFAAVERGKYEQEQFYRASERLNEALTLDDVYARTFDAIGAMAGFDLCAITRYEGHASRHRVLAVKLGTQERHTGWDKLAERLGGRTFDDGPSLVSMALKNRHHMPASGDFPDRSVVVFDDSTRLDRASSVLVLPLVRGEQVLGTIVLASEREHSYPAAQREMLRVISHQVGVSLQNARMYQQMEERATTDGLTGLTNHRAFQERFEQLHALSERGGQTFSLILTDIDHFKSVNDTYGHPVGDAVLKRVAALFAGRARKVDIVARYGGEEFVLVLPGTDAEGAMLFANRIREEVAAQQMTSEHGSFQVTLSMGVAEYPSDSTDRAQLVELADQALYVCKENGRNQVRRAAP